MNLLLIAHDFPYGNAETFLETEIKYATDIFEKIYVISASRSNELTRTLPSSVIPVKASREYHKYRCALYGMIKTISPKSIVEIIRKRPEAVSIEAAFKKVFMYYAIEKRLVDKVKEEHLVGQEFIAYSYWLAEGAFFLAQNKNLWKSVFSRVHSYEVWQESFTPFLCDTVEKLDAIFSIADNTSKLVLNHIEENRKSSIEKKIELSRLGIENDGDGNLREKNCNEVYRIVTCSSIYHLKRLDMIVDIVSKLDDLDKCVEWIHFGGGTDEEQIRQYAEKKLQSDRIKWSISGWIDNSDVLMFYKTENVDLFMNMSDNEGIPVSIMEAMAYGIPCVARNVGGNSEIVNNVNGCIVSKSATVEEIADKIKDLLTHPLDKNKIVDFYNNNYNAELNYSKFYLKLIDETQ